MNMTSVVAHIIQLTSPLSTPSMADILRRVLHAPSPEADRDRTPHSSCR